MTLPEFYETCREVNRFLAAGAFLWLTWRSVRAWPAEWAKPDHPWHYRLLLILGSGALLGITFVAFWYTRLAAPPTAASPLFSAVCLLGLVICARWPKPRAYRKEPS